MLRNYYQGTMITVELPKNQYKGYVVSEIDGRYGQYDKVFFTNG